jgi:hypothetical protein
MIFFHSLKAWQRCPSTVSVGVPLNHSLACAFGAIWINVLAESRLRFNGGVDER